jgi:hypothetical protein
MKNRNAACSCGRLHLVASGDPVRISVCHCLACQRRTGSVFGEQARFPADAIAIRGTAARYVRTADSGTKISYYFCPNCGSTVYYQSQDQQDLIAVPVGAFADPAFPAPRVSVHETRKHGWVAMPPDIELE